MPYKEFYATYDTKDPVGWIGGWLQAWSDAGWVRTDDTGQINPATVTIPTVAGLMGYVMYRLDDEIQATAPVYIRIEFHSRTSTGTGPTLRLSIGRATNGQGLLLGILLPSTPLGNVQANTALDTITSPTRGYAAAGPSWIGHFPHVESSSVGAHLRYASFMVERSRDSTGNPTADGIMVCFAGTANATSAGCPTVMAINYDSAVYSRGTAPVSIPRNINGAVLGPSTSLSAGTLSPVFPWVLFAPGVPPWMSRVAVSYPAGDSPGGLFQTTVFSVSSTFRAIPVTLEYQGYGASVEPNSTSYTLSLGIGLAFLWEQ